MECRTSINSRIWPGLPINRRRNATMIQSYKRKGAWRPLRLNVLSGEVVGPRAKRPAHRVVRVSVVCYLGRVMEANENDKEGQATACQDTRWEGGCACGEIRYVYEGLPVLSLKCHCLDCQARSGAGHLAMLWAWRDGFRMITGEPRYYGMQGGSGKFVQRGSCPDCGTLVSAEIELIPSVVGIIATSLDATELFMPEFELWTSRAPSWDPLDPSLQHFASGFDRDVILSRLTR